MKKILESFYVLSKFSFSLILILCLLFLLYVFFVNYQNQENISINQKNLSNNLKNEISENTKSIEKISLEIKETKSTLIKIEKALNSLPKNKKNEDFDQLGKSINSINDKLNLLNSEVTKIKQNNKDSNIVNSKNQSIIESSKSDIIDLIMLKYENNISIENELTYLESIIENNNKKYIEKILILQNKPFKGHKYLKKIFNKELNFYLKNDIYNNSNKLFRRFILPYVNISPTSENIIDDNLILKLNEVDVSIKNKNIENALNKISQLNNYENSFKKSLYEMNNYLNFKTELSRIK